MNLKNFITQKSFELGFTNIGFTTAIVEEREQVNLKNWLNKNYHAEMNWMERNFEKRINPNLVLDGVKSVIMLGTNYNTNFKHSSETGKISRYAWGMDYHNILDERIQKLISCIKEVDSTGEYKFYVDTGPVMEKYFAEKSGIGWRGKHTNVISKNFGSWIFLSSILTTTDFKIDESFEDFCGTCTACIDACPTNAIIEPYLLDSNRCISYLTIEHKKEIDEKLGEKFEGWIYGCDICQEVCPWNKFEKKSDDESFIPFKSETNLNLNKIINLDEEEFKTRFKNSPIKRTKLNRMKRNAKILNKKEEYVKS